MRAKKISFDDMGACFVLRDYYGLSMSAIADKFEIHARTMARYFRCAELHGKEFFDGNGE